MNILKRATTNITRQPLRSTVLFLLIFVLGVAMAGALSVRLALISAEENLIAQLPAVSTIGVREDAEIVSFPIAQPTEDALNAIGQLSYVRAYDFYMRTHFWSSDLMWSEGMTNNGLYHFTIKGVNNPEVTDLVAGAIGLIDGRTFTQAEIDRRALVVMVPEDFAQTNQLTVGSTLEIEKTIDSDGFFTQWHRFEEDENASILVSETLEIEIIGIFNRDIETDFKVDNSCANCYLYMPFSVTERMLAFENEAFITAGLDWMLGTQGHRMEPFLEVLYIMYDPRDLGAFTLEANDLLPDIWEMVHLGDSQVHVTTSMDMVLQIADAVGSVAVVATILVLTLVISLFLRDRRHEIGVYMALGDKKLKVVTQILVEIGFVAIAAMVLALFVGNLLSETVSSQMLEQQVMDQMTAGVQYGAVIPWELAVFNPRNISVEEMMALYDVSLGLDTTLIFVGMGMTVILISTILPIWYVVKLEPKKILL